MLEASEDRQSQRRALRARRGALKPSDRRRGALGAARRAGHLASLRQARAVGLYLAVGAELDAGPLIKALWARGKRCYLPVLSRFPQKTLHFVRYTPSTRLRRNRLGIPEPVRGARCAPRALDLLFGPLLGFDRAGRRLGMGGGYYDRSLRRLARTRQWRRPLLVGLAYEIQGIAEIEDRPWDIPLAGVVTEQHQYTWRRS